MKAWIDDNNVEEILPVKSPGKSVEMKDEDLQKWIDDDKTYPDTKIRELLRKMV